jgi:tetratricopeptide (TPR) repeat protein
MKNIFFISQLSALMIVLITIGAGFFNKPVTPIQYEKRDILSCAPGIDNFSPKDANGKYIPLLTGLGHHSYAITTNDDSAQIYFNQGLNFYYSFHFREALASFKESARFDSTCAMTYWGQALASGPYYNEYYYKMKKGIAEILHSMDKYAANGSEEEKDLVNAMKQRYSADTTNADRPQLDKNYAAALSSLIKKYNSDNDIKAMYVDAMMLAHRWDFWNNDGTPKPWTPELVSLCEEILKREPNHPAALHYYIHVTEASRQTKLALHSADVLKEVMPGVSHVVHMSTHMYQRNGLFVKGVEINEEANNVFNAVDSLAPMLNYGKNMVIHIYAVQSYCAMNAGMYNSAMRIYERARDRLIFGRKPDFPNDTYNQFVYMIPVIAAVRLGKWEEVLQSPAPDADWKYARVLDYFAKGMAYVHRNDMNTAKACLDSLQWNLKDSLLNVRLMPFNTPAQSGRIAAAILKGKILFTEKKWDESVAVFREAVAEEDNEIYREPPDWFIPARQYLGAYLLQMNKAREAEQVYREDLVWNPGNGWSLLGLYQTLIAQHKTKEAAAYKIQYTKAFEEADVEIKASVF